MSSSRPHLPRPVHVVVLAAGRGSRLGALGDARPKWLLEVGGRTLADRHLSAIADAAGVASVRVVTGHAAHAIEQELAGRPARIGTVHVPEYAERNNWWSLLCALRSLPAREPVVVVNADLCVDPAALTAFLDDARGQEADGLLAVDVERPVTQESMKVAVGADGSLTAIGKLGVDAPLGEYVGLLMARGDVLEALQAELEAFEREPGAHDQWYEGAIGRSASAGASWQVWPMSDPGWVEIDDDADLAQAEDLVGTR